MRLRTLDVMQSEKLGPLDGLSISVMTLPGALTTPARIKIAIAELVKGES